MSSIFELIRDIYDPTKRLLKVKRSLQDNSNQLTTGIKKLALAQLNFKLGSSIPYNAKFDEDPYFPHGARGVFISGGAHIGKHAVIFQHVTIGSNSIQGSSRYGCPDIGDNCYIGAGAIIIGKVKIGNNVRIGAGAIVNKDVPDDSIVI